MITVNQAAIMVNVSNQTIRNALNRGELKGEIYKADKYQKYEVDETDLIRWYKTYQTKRPNQYTITLTNEEQELLLKKVSSNETISIYIGRLIRNDI